MRAARLRPSLLLVALPLLAALVGRDEPVPLAGGADVASGVLEFEVLDQDGAALPARLTFRPLDTPPGAEREAPAVFADFHAAPQELAVRSDVVTTRSGRGRITVPVGRYEVWASHGLEWSLARTELAITADEPARFAARLRHEVDTRGWISGDFHLHTLTHSGHGDAELEERVLTFLGEGLEFAVATDHNHNTDYGPTVAALGVGGRIATATGNEVSTPIGHFNAFPLDPARAPVDAQSRDAGPLFALLRSERDARGRAPVIQVNHPRWSGIDYFALAGLDPITGKSAAPAWSRDFDAIEVLNENTGWGFHEPGETTSDTGSNRHSVLRDWFRLLNRGERYAAVGNSDSHHVRAVLPGYPRNFVRSPTDDPGAIEVEDVAQAVREKQLFTTLGPFVEFTVEGVPMGGTARATDGHARLELRLQAASWIDCDRVRVIVDGDEAQVLEVPDTRAVRRLERTIELCLCRPCPRHGEPQEPAGEAAPGPPVAHDAWVVLVVEGDEPLPDPLFRAARPVLPWCLTNPVWIDGDGDGTWTAPAERVAAALAAQPTPEVAREWFPGLSPEEQVLALAAVPRGPFAGVLITLGLASPQRVVRLAAARAGERCAVRGTSGAFESAFQATTEDAWLAAVLRRALLAARPELAAVSLEIYVQRFGMQGLRGQRDELDLAAAGLVLRDWRVLGDLPFDSPAAGACDHTDTIPPEVLDRRGQAPLWRTASADASGYLDLAAVHGSRDPGTLALAETWLKSQGPRRVALALGTDDGSRLWLDDELIYDDPRPRGADPFERLEFLELHRGWNRLRFEVRNEGGPSGLYARVLASGLQSAAEPER